MVAVYGAILSTATACVQVMNFFRDRVRLKVSAMFSSGP
jgi:hypothetical protein